MAPFLGPFLELRREGYCSNLRWSLQECNSLLLLFFSIFWVSRRIMFSLSLKVLCPSRWPCGEVDFNICYNNCEHSAFRWFMESLGYSGRGSLRKQAFLIKRAQTVALSCIDLYFWIVKQHIICPMETSRSNLCTYLYTQELFYRVVEGLSFVTCWLLLGLAQPRQRFGALVCCTCDIQPMLSSLLCSYSSDSWSLTHVARKYTFLWYPDAVLLRCVIEVCLRCKSP